jgi:hypothetical protein
VGTVFELTPPSTKGADWAESILLSFNGTDGDYPVAGLIMDKNGNLYGTTSGAANSSDGTVFELTPPSIPGGSWGEATLWNFEGYPDGSGPKADLIMDPKTGDLYGTTAGGGAHQYYGTVFKLTPPSTSQPNWSEEILWNFPSYTHDGYFPEAGLIMDTSGDLYGTTAEGGAYNPGAGTVFKISGIATPPTPPTLTVSPTSLGFLTVGTDTTASKTLTLKNSGAGVRTGSVETLSAPFSITAGGGAFILPPGQTKTVTVQFAPTTPGASAGTLVITSNDLKHPSVSVKVSGTGVAGALSVPSLVTFPSTTVGLSSTEKGTITRMRDWACCMETSARLPDPSR